MAKRHLSVFSMLVLFGVAAVAAAQPVEVQFESGLMTLKCQDTSIATVFERIEEVTGVEVILEDEVKNKRVKVIGKEEITIRQLLSHQAGLHAFHEKVDKEVIADPDRLAQIMEAERPAWPPGQHYAYHILSLGFYESELIRRVDPKHRTLGQLFQDEIATPLGLDFYIRLPPEIPNDRFALGHIMA